MSDVGWIAIIVLGTIAAPMFVFLMAKMVTLGVLYGKRAFDRDQKRDKWEKHLP